MPLFGLLKKKDGNQPAMIGGGTGGGGNSGGRRGSTVNDFISRTKQQGIKPSGPELVAYARYLGMDAVADHDLLWIAEEALAAPLPADWTEHFDSADRVFYYNSSEQVSSWTHPLEKVYRDAYQSIASFRNSTNLGQQEKMSELRGLQSEIENMDRSVHREVSLWSEHADEQGNRFYFNKQTGKSTWTDPRPAKCQVLYLKMKILKGMCEHAGVDPNDLVIQKPDSLPMIHKPKKEKKSKRRDSNEPYVGTPPPERADSMDREEEGRKKKKKKKKKQKEEVRFSFLGKSKNLPSRTAT